VNKFNSTNKFYKKGIALTPVKFGISFTTSHLNQAGALVNIYRDGTVLVNHGGVEMGQGLHTKIRSVAAGEFGIDESQVRVSPTNTSKVPNASATAASSGADMNGMAVKNACEKLKKRIAGVIAEYFSKQGAEKRTLPEKITFSDGIIYDSENPRRKLPFSEAMSVVHFNRESLSATGFYKTPGIHFDRAAGKGEPFYYYAFGMAVTEILLDTLTGSHTILRTDILHDAGDSLNPGIDKGQITGGYMQGVGWVTTEECTWDEKGNLLQFSPGTYKIPTIGDIPEDFRVELLEGFPQPGTILKSKAVGEPPVMLALSCWLAIMDAVSATGEHRIDPELHIPASCESILMALDKIKRQLMLKK
jgi:xanthine dehydrogenase molybdopterin-binding subunit B